MNLLTNNFGMTQPPNHSLRTILATITCLPPPNLFTILEPNTHIIWSREICFRFLILYSEARSWTMDLFLGITRAGRVIKISHLIHQVHLTYQKCYRILTKLQRIFNAETKTTLVMILKIQNPALVCLSLCKINRSQPRRTFLCKCRIQRNWKFSFCCPDDKFDNLKMHFYHFCHLDTPSDLSTH